MNTASRSAFAALLFSIMPACASDPASMDPMPEPTEDPQPEPTPDPQPTPTPLASGELDTTFGVGGVLPLTELGEGLYAAELAVQGAQLLACTSYLSGSSLTGKVARINTDGTVDKTFGSYGFFSLTAAGAAHSACTGLAVLDDKIAVTFTNLDTGVQSVMFIAPDGKTMYPNIEPIMSRVTRGLGSQSQLVSAGVSQVGNIGVMLRTTDTSSFTWTPSSLSGATTRTFAKDNLRIAVGAYDIDKDGHREWSMLVNDGANKLQSSAATVSLGDPNLDDLMLDAALLPDGTVFAVGAIDTGKQVLAARFTTDGVDIENHAQGAASMGRAVMLDSADRPVVVGTATGVSGTVFGWQRYDVSGATGLALDSNYRDSGQATVAPPSGQGELVDAVRIGDRIYMLGQYDVETAAPKLALVKIAD